MVARVARGDIWMYRFRAPDKRRPVLVISRPNALGLLHTATVASITSTIRGAPSEVVIGIDEGLKHDSAISLDHLHCVEQSRLEQRVGSLGPEKMRAVCAALAIATGCDA